MKLLGTQRLAPCGTLIVKPLFYLAYFDIETSVLETLFQKKSLYQYHV